MLFRTLVASVLLLRLAAALISANAAPPPGYYQVWGDEFNGSSLDTTKWDYWVDNRIWGKAYNDGALAVSVSNGHLVVTTKTINGTNFTAMVASDNHFRPRYGYYEASIQWGDYSGMWSAFWLRSPILGTFLNDPMDDGGELDVCEHRYVGVYGTNIANVVSDNVHWNGYGSAEQSTGSPNVGSGLATGFHTYSLLWTNDWYDFGVDGSTAWHTGYNGSPPTPQFGSSVYIILSSQVDDSGTPPPWAGYIPSGGYPTGTNQLVVDYFRYYAPTNVLFWTGSASAYWTNSPNWVSNMVPAALNDLTFSYLSQTLNCSLGADCAAHGLIFLNTLANPTIGGTNTLSLGAGGIDTIAADHNITLNCPIKINANQRWTVGRNNPGNQLFVNGNISGAATLTKAGYGTLVLKGTNSFSGVLNVDTGNSNTNDGAVIIDGTAAMANAASPIYIRNTGLADSSLQLTNTVTLSQEISLAGRNTNSPAIKTLSSGQTCVLGGGLTLQGAGSNYILQCSVGTLALGGVTSAASTAGANPLLLLQGNGTFDVTGSIQNGSASALAVVRTNGGTLKISGTNTYTGGTTNWASTVFVNGTVPGLFDMKNGVLSGTGSIAGNAWLEAGHLNPGSAASGDIGTLSFGSSVSLGGSFLTTLEINAAQQTNDSLNIAGTLNCAGTLQVLNLGGALVAGQSFKLINAGVMAGNFAALLLPSLDNGLAWDTTSLLRNGFLSVAAVPAVTMPPSATNVECGSTLALTATLSGTPPFMCQWFDNQTNSIAGATNATLTLPHVTAAQVGNYTLVVTNNVGSGSGVVSLGNVVDTTAPVVLWSFTNLTLNAASNHQAVMPDVTGTNFIRATDACSALLHITQSPTNGATLALGTNLVVIAVADDSGNSTFSTNSIAVLNSGPQTLSIVNLGGGWLQLDWQQGTLQNAPAIGGQFTDIPGANPPYKVQATNSQKFFRLAD